MARRRSTRRGRGEGSVFEQANGTWRGKVTVGYTEEGKQRFKWVSGKTQAEALTKIGEIKQQIALGTFSNTKLTVKAYIEQWLTEKAREVKPQTAEDYRYQLEKYVTPIIR